MTPRKRISTAKGSLSPFALARCRGMRPPMMRGITRSSGERFLPSDPRTTRSNSASTAAEIRLRCWLPGDAYGPGASVRAFGTSYTLNDAGYHTYDLVFNPNTQSASLFIDGVERISGYTGYTYNLSADWGLVFGALSGGGMNFNLVRLTSPAVVPGFQWGCHGQY